MKVRSKAKYLDHIVHDSWCLKKDVIRHAETHMKSLESASIIYDTRKNLTLDYINNDDKFLSLTNGCQGEIAIIKKFDINDISIISLTKDNFQERVFKLMLVY